MLGEQEITPTVETAELKVKVQIEKEEEEDIFSSEMFEEPVDFRPASPKPTETTFKRRIETSNLQTLKVHLPPQHSLWAHKLWNAGQSMAHYIDANPELVRGKRVLELGAAASLPSIVSALNGASSVVSTDYPDPILIENIVKNATANIPQLLEEGTFKVKGFIWGQEETIHELAEEGCYDLILLADVIFNHNQHENLLRSCRELLKSGGTVFTTYSHHVVKWADRDMEFFKIAKDFGFVATQLYVEKWQEMFPEDAGSLDVRRTVFAWNLTL